MRQASLAEKRERREEYEQQDQGGNQHHPFDRLVLEGQDLVHVLFH